MSLRWFKSLNPIAKLLVLSGLIFALVAFYIPLSKYIKPAILSVLSPSLKFCEDISSNARQFFVFQDLIEENKRLKDEIDNLTAQLVQLQEAWQENQRLRGLLSLPKSKSFQTRTAFVIGKDSSNLTSTVMINKGTLNGVKKGMPVVLGAGLVGRVIEVSPNTAKVILIVDFNSKIPAKIAGSREEGVVFGNFSKRGNLCKMKYIQKAQVGDEVISSGLGEIYPKGLLIGKIVAVEEGENRLYKIAEIQPKVNFSTMEEVMVIIGQ
ncbi:MAG: rod shape-determining protein MreC [Candidatus Omnitrophica bacterium]|nr:rod shape-determining protein MreC [Candidatus Omnitrophota bacterium]